MKSQQYRWTEETGWVPTRPLGGKAQLVLLFGSAAVLRRPGFLKEISEDYPYALHFGCSTAGEICGATVSDDSLVVTAIQFERSTIQSAHVRLADFPDSRAAGSELGARLRPEGLRHAFVLSDGLLVNGSELVQGLRKVLPDGVTVTGGLSADGPHFKQTFVVWDGIPQVGIAGIIGLYGDQLRVGYGSLGGWDPFGPERLVTRSKGNVVFEFDNRSALELYRTYLGDHASQLPAAGLLFPLCVRSPDADAGIVRTILGIDEREQSLLFAGDIAEGSLAQLMKANFDRLIDGAVGAAHASHHGLGAEADLAILISCVGRKLVLRQRVEEEVEGVRDVLGHRTTMTGFYSYGEISPFSKSASCELHNQTMTVTTLAEVP